jgi:benzoyl-CoA reductase/2-hydroxyglutaryl-CoA dehydratase subunit BcrC/BadD/HgdB
MGLKQTPLDLVEEAYAERHARCRRLRGRGLHLLGWTCTYIPEEPILAMGVTPVRVAPPLGSTPTANAYLPVNACPAMKACFEAAAKGVYDYLDGVVFSNSCDHMGRVFDVWKLHGVGGRLHFFNTPHSKRDAARKMYLHELEKLRGFLEGLYGRPMDLEGVRQAISLMNRLRSALKRLEEARREDPPSLTGVESFYASAISAALPKEEALGLIEGLMEGLPGPRSELKGRLRILVTGSYIDEEARLLKLVEDAGGVVVFEDTCTGSRYYDGLVEEAGDPLEALTRRYLEKVPCPFMDHSEERLAAVKEAVRRFNVHGVLTWVVKFCDVHLFDAPMMAEELRDMGVPHMALEWSPTEVEWAQLKTRVEAFMESLR